MQFNCIPFSKSNNFDRISNEMKLKKKNKRKEKQAIANLKLDIFFVQCSLQRKIYKH